MQTASMDEAYEEVCKVLGLSGHQKLSCRGSDPICPSVHRIGDATAIALSALGAELASLWKQRTGQEETFSVSTEGSIAQLKALYTFTINGVPSMNLVEDLKLLATSDFYQDRNGRWLFLMNAYPALRDINCAVLDCPLDRERLTKEVGKRDAFALEEEIQGKGGCCIVARTSDEWSSSPPGQWLETQPLISIEKIADSPPEPMPPMVETEAGLPFEGFKVLDNTHVLAGPMSSRLAAEFGAEVLHIACPSRNDPTALVIETGIGKRSAWCNLDKENDQEKFWNTLKGADVYVTSYLTLDRKGYGPADLAKHRPGIVFVDYHAFGANGPWHERHGFEQLACATTGFSVREGGEAGKPALPPTLLLNDYITSLLGAAGMIEALKRRAVEGGSWRVSVNLSKACMWVQSLGILSRDQVNHLPRPDVAALKDKIGLKTVDGPYGVTEYLPTQIFFGDKIKPRLTRGAEPVGASQMKWLNS